MGSMTRKHISTPDITAGITDTERLLSLAPPGAASAERAVLPFRLTQLVVARFDMEVVEAAVFLNLCGAAPIQASQNADAEFHVHLRRVIDRYRLDCLFVEDGPGQYHHATRPRGYDYSVDAVHPKDMEAWRADYRSMHPVQQIFAASIIWLYRGGKDHVWLRRVPCTWLAAEALQVLRESDALSDWGRLIFLFPGW
jgi:hypothetical protein